MGILSSLFGLFAKQPAFTNVKSPARPSPGAAAKTAPKPPAAALESVRRTPVGEAAPGRLDPQSPALPLPVSLARVVRPANEALSVEKLNAAPGWNPFLTGDAQAKSQGALAGLGPYREASEIFDSKTIVPVQMIFAEFAKTLAGPVQAAIKPLADALAPSAVLRTPAHKFDIDGKPGARVVFFGGAEGRQHDALDAVVRELGKQGYRFVVQWLHISEPMLSSSSQGGRLKEDILGNQYKPPGSSHIMGFSLGEIEGKPVTVINNWGNQSIFDNSNSAFAAHIFAVDYQAGASDPIPAATLAHYKRNADMWDCIAAMVVPFTGEDPFGYTGFELNPLEVHDQASARAVAADLASLDWTKFRQKFGAFYCGEALYTSANLGPQEDALGGTLLKESRFGGTRLGLLFKTFQEAPEYKDKPIEWRRRNPQHGWRHLCAEGPGEGGISEDQYEKLAIKRIPDAAAGEGDFGFCAKTYSNRQGVFLEWIPEDVKGWQAYRPKNREGLIASPMTTGALAWTLLRAYAPREGLARTIAAEIAIACQAGGDAVKAAAKNLIGGADPLSPEGSQALGAFAFQLASGLVVTSITSSEDLSEAEKKVYDSKMQKDLFVPAMFEEITNDADKAKVKQAWNEFVAILGDPKFAAQDALDAALVEADRRTAGLEVERRAKDHIFKGLVTYAAPGCWSTWAQQPFVSESHALRYVGTLVHKDMASSDAA